RHIAPFQRIADILPRLDLVKVGQRDLAGPIALGLDVVPRRKVLSVAAQHDHVNVGIVGSGCPPGVEFAQQFGVLRVGRLWAVEAYRRDLLRPLVLHELLFHDSSQSGRLMAAKPTVAIAAISLSLPRNISTCTTTDRLPVRRIRATARAGPTVTGRR